jgi:hypothetical protein
LVRRIDARIVTVIVAGIGGWLATLRRGARRTLSGRVAEAQVAEELARGSTVPELALSWSKV